MGCFPSGTKEQPSKIGRLEELKIQPATFVVSNQRQFQQVYKLGRLLGTGSYGEVRRAVNRQTHAQRAVKIFRKDYYSSVQFKKKMTYEIKLLKPLDHINIIRIYEYFEDNKRIYLVMEHCKGGELFDQIIKREYFHQYQAAQILKQILSAVGYIHQQGIIHRDLKPENILLEQNQQNGFNIKIIDFGTAVHYQEQKTLTGILGTAYYVAPEVLSGSYSKKCDIWSCGVILYILLSGIPPFDGKSDQQILQKVRQGVYSLQKGVWEKVSQQAKDLIKKLLCPEQVRLSAFQALRHPWMLKNTQESKIQGQAMLGILNNLKGFHSTSKLRDAVHTYVATQCISAIDIKELREAFRAIDTNGDGRLSREELMNKYTEYMGFDEAEEEVDRIMRTVDTDNSGFIDYTEFVKATMDPKKVMSTQNLRIAFDLFDRDGSGSISASQLKKVLEGGAVSSEKVWAQIVREVDQNGDGEIDLHEFEEIILRNV